MVRLDRAVRTLALVLYLSEGSERTYRRLRVINGAIEDGSFLIVICPPHSTPSTLPCARG